MDALLTNTDQPVIPHKSKSFRNIPERWRYVLYLHLSGYSYDDIAELTQYSKISIGRILGDPRIVSIRQQMLVGLDAEFESLYSSVIEAIRDGLNHSDMKFRLEAADKWFKAMGKYKEGNKQVVQVTAEDVVVKILSSDEI